MKLENSFLRFIVECFDFFFIDWIIFLSLVYVVIYYEVDYLFYVGLVGFSYIKCSLFVSFVVIYYCFMLGRMCFF